MPPEVIRTAPRKSPNWENAKTQASLRPTIRSVRCGNADSAQSVRLTLEINPTLCGDLVCRRLACSDPLQMR